MSHFRLVTIHWLDEDLRDMPRDERLAALAAARRFNTFVERRAWLTDLKLRLEDALVEAEAGKFDWSTRPEPNPLSLVATQYGVDPHTLTHDDGVLYIVTDADLKRARQIFREAMARVAAWYDAHDDGVLYIMTGEPLEKDEG